MVQVTDTVDCPRCGQEVRELLSLPEAVLEGTTSDGPGADVQYGRACEWCRHEILEG